MKPSQPLLGPTLDRLQFWRTELKAATAANDLPRLEECALLVEQCERLIAGMLRQELEQKDVP